MSHRRPCPPGSAGEGTAPRTRPLVAYAVALALLTASTGSAAIGLGEAAVASSLGRRLDITVPVLGTAGVGWPERCSWQLRDAVTSTGRALDGARLARGGQGGAPGLRLTTSRVVSEPVVSFGVYLACGTGHRLRRDYTVLLDPPGYAALPVRPPAPRQSRLPVAAPREGAPAAPAPGPAPSPFSAPEAGATVRVQTGDTLSALVRRHYPSGVGGPALFDAIVAANPHAFRDGNPDLLLAGARLNLPDPAPAVDGPVSRVAEVAATAAAEPASEGLLRLLSADEELVQPLALSESLAAQPSRQTVAAVPEQGASRPIRAAEPPTEATAPAPPAAGAAPEPVAMEPAMAGRTPAAADPALTEALGAARKRLRDMEDEMAALRLEVAELTRVLAAREEAARAAGSSWLWPAAVAALAAALAGALLMLVRRRRDEGYTRGPAAGSGMAAHASMVMPSAGRGSGDAGGADASAAPTPAGPARDEDTQERTLGLLRDDDTHERTFELLRDEDTHERTLKLPRDEDTLEETLELASDQHEPAIGPTVDAEFIDVVPEDDAPAREAAASGREAVRVLNVRLLEAELHILYQQWRDAEILLEELMAMETAGRPDMRPWHLAFELYRQKGDPAGFDALVERFGRRFNVMPPRWHDGSPEPGDLEGHYPHLVSHICALWDTPRAASFLDELLLDDRGGTRIGLAAEAAEEIGFLRDLLGFRREVTAGTVPGYRLAAGG